MPMKKGHGFSLIEVLVALSLIGMAAATLMLATASTTTASSDAAGQFMARGIAEQILDDLLGQPYHEYGGSATNLPMGPENGETSTPPKSSLFDDADDFHGYSSKPPRDPWGIELGQGDGVGGMRRESFRLPSGYFTDWQVDVQVTYVDESNPAVDLAAAQTSGMRAARVRVSRTVNGRGEELANVRRVFAYVQSTSP